MKGINYFKGKVKYIHVYIYTFIIEIKSQINQEYNPILNWQNPLPWQPRQHCLQKGYSILWRKRFCFKWHLYICYHCIIVFLTKIVPRTQNSQSNLLKPVKIFVKKKDIYILFKSTLKNILRPEVFVVHVSLLGVFWLGSLWCPKSPLHRLAYEFW